MADTVLAVEIREKSGKQLARRLRAQGKIPAVLYGRGKPSISISLGARELERALQASEAGLNTLFDLRFPASGEAVERVALVKELQRDPVRGGLLHADLFEIDLAQSVEVSVPIHLVGRPQGVEMGGVLDHTLRELEIECLPRAIPDSIEVDVSRMEIGDVIHVSDLPLPEGVELRADPELAVAHVSAPTVEEEAIAPEAEIPAGEEAPAEAPAEGEPEEEAE